MSISYGGDYITDTDGGKLRPSSAVFRNRILNGGMVIDQRNAGASVTATSDNQTFSVDRYRLYASQNSKYTAQQNAGSVTPPVGFTNYLGATSSAATSVGASEYYSVIQRLEGFNVADLGWGTANAKTVTLSFWVRSSLTGTFGGSLTNSAYNRSYPYSYTISAANTWEQKSVTITGDTSGTWLTTNGIGIELSFGLGVGSTYSGTAGSWAGSWYNSATGATSVVGTNGATFYITGVQLEVGSSATGFEYRQYGTELQLCQRYYQKSCDQSTVPASGNYSVSGIVGCHGSSNGWSPTYTLRQTMRTAPTMTMYQWQSFNGSAFVSWTNNVAGNLRDTNFYVDLSGNFSSSTGSSYLLKGDWTASAEL